MKQHLATELKSLIGWGVPKHCLTRPTLRDLISQRYPEGVGRDLALLIEKEIEAAAYKLPSAKARACLVLLWLSHEATNNATINRELAISYLGLHISVETFRRPIGPELSLMQELAQKLQEPSGVVWMADCEVVSHAPLELRLRLRQA